ncbi:PREDICTED: probable inactive leucine-rich repeat receptor-like protein kinase At3g03770 [Tarenaya hassleriana]|uniref:probable inactive leucine-rich repeat receptor-like protein kinase At3g03770 n=1 Tax=Tarenaya hassleriana TaxID=28532 RepID=UPI00053CA91F|nr:PREDICTED: probable inactive leucine-rich repeat receptor-like protein kinase At3g03770 [Tarenaya hassleriana]XP_010549700.1 PREDICTED: probable inactive leucine-rich repeat receptor-like protein kinase At3g03770 [Tarenaya hassleriana]XP_010549701.1 PREDICTED: probable inactive leucine-rich repeat receptor-like protein kinase At3g03770 [Tarenaya hassleriana]XP_010549703.1 PREDICTED: probable inactive leucine-rich repeat receptor-like protein kinase At3g03770 [Tarenaya hassleriana]
MPCMLSSAMRRQAVSLCMISAMERAFCSSALLVLVLLLAAIDGSWHLQSSQSQTLFRLQQLLYYPRVLSSWNSSTDFCNSEPNPSLTVVCYEESVTQLHIIGNRRARLLPKSFSIDSFVTTLVKLPDIKVLTLVSLGLWGPLPGKFNRLSSLEIFNVSSNFLFGAIPHELSSLASLQTLILDENMFSGQLPGWIGSISGLKVLSLRKNAFNGSLPSSLSGLSGLRVLDLANNRFNGEVPDLSHLTNLQVLDVEGNSLGPQFPRLGNKLVTLILSKNRFRSGIPAEEVGSFYQLQHLDLSSNMFIGPFPMSVLSLPGISYLNISQNKFTGRLNLNLSCNSELMVVDLSSNLLTGSLPTCLKPSSKSRLIAYWGNCLATGDENQHPVSFCSNEALAVGILPQRKKKVSKVGLALGITAGVIGVVLLVGFLSVFVRRVNSEKTAKKAPPRLITENATTGYTSKLLSDARYISQTMKLGALGIPAYRTFSLEELEYATNNFETSAFMGEGSQGQIYRGKLKDGSFVAIRCLKMKKSCSTQNFMHHIELIAKLRHRHLVSALGHCFECYLDDSTVSRMFLVFEFVPNGNLRSWISDGHMGRLLTWEQRISAAIGVAKGIQFLHTGIVPGVYANNLKITDILLDNNLGPKISSYNLPLLEGLGKAGQGIHSSGSKDNAGMKDGDKLDIYDFGMILLELIVGRPLKTKSQVDVLKDQLQGSITVDDARRSMVDPTVHRACSDESLKTMMEICMRCLLKDTSERPSIEDVLWNLQFASQVQDGWLHNSNPPSSRGSPVPAVSSLPPPRLHLTTLETPRDSGYGEHER